MKRIFSSGLIEPLEARIAPATIRIGAIDIFNNPDFSSDTEYHEVGPDRGELYNKLSFIDTSTSGDVISSAVDSPLSDNTFYLRLQAGDTVERFTQNSNYQSFILVKTGRVIAYFTDLNGNNNFDDDELTGLSLGANTVVEINGRVNGDILTNLDEHGNKDPLDDSIDVKGLISTNQGITSLKVLGGSVLGSIFSGGTVKNIVVANNVDSILAGTAVYNSGFDVFKIVDPLTPNGFLPERFTLETPLSSSVPSKAIGSSILNTTVGSITDRIEAGGGGFGSKGGSLNDIKVLGDADGFKLLAGAGGNGNAAIKRLSGGAGGDLANIYIAGKVDNTPNSELGIVLKAGSGGDGGVNSKGGAGGKATNIQVGFEFIAGSTVASTELISDSLSIAGGFGGSGKTAGIGGAVSQIKVRMLTPDAQGNEIEILGGDGGANSVARGKAGAGGSVTNIDIRNQIATPESDILVKAGNAGLANQASAGAVGGSIQNASLLGFDITLTGGNGSDGRTGGIGGTISDIIITRDDAVIARNVTVNAGEGGDASASKGAAGGEVRNIEADSGDFESFLINTGTAANGGSGSKGLGGKGGGVSHIDIGDFNSNLGLSVSLEGSVNFRGGLGGDGTKGGGAGGSLLDVDLRGADNLNLTAIAGTGGNATLAGKGGAGGSLDLVQLTSDGFVGDNYVTGSLQSGDGGTGKGKKGTGGNGGDIRTTSLSVDGDGTIIAGDGGNGQIAAPGVSGAAPGRGGSVIATGLFGRFGSGDLHAGDAGIAGAKPGAGGSILGSLGTLSGVRAGNNITITAGNGSHGGAGGDIVGLTYGSTSESLTPTPIGTILIQSGNGSVEGKLAGRGGNITNVSGAVSSGLNKTTQFFAGDGGSGPAVTKAATGGSISDITISRGGAAGGVLTFEAGDAGNAPAAAKGAAGGSVSKIGVGELALGTVFRSVAAGNGGSGLRSGGAGGSIDGVDAQNLDIGVRTGQTYGYTTMGGLFAGVGGSGSSAGVNGNVTNITADAISSIVAGRSGAPRMAEKAGNIYVLGEPSSLLLSSNNALVPNGDFQLRFGSQQTPILPNGSTAESVQAALNQLSGIADAGGVMVSSNKLRGYEIRFNKPGNQPLLSGVEIVPGDVTEEIRGAVETLPVTTLVEGSVSLPVVEARPGEAAINVIEPVPGSAVIRTTELVPGSDTDVEVQALDLAGLTPFPGGTFTLTYKGFKTDPLPSNVTASALQTALNALAPIKSAGGVIVDILDANRFAIIFQTLGEQPRIDGVGLIPETQRIDIGSVATSANGLFTLSFEGATTAPIAGTASAADIAAALNSIIDPSKGQVNVTSIGTGQFNITFGVNGNQSALTGIGRVPEIQEISLQALSAISGTTFTISAGNETTSLLPATATAAQIQVALNNLPSVKASGGVLVSVSPNHVVDIAFRQIGQQVNFTSAAFQPELQSIDLSGAKGATSEYTLSVEHALSVIESSKGTFVTTLGNDKVTPPFKLITLPAVTSVDGTPQTKETQTIDITTVSAAGTQYVLNFNGQNTGLIKTAGLTSAQTATAISNALNALSTVKVAGGLTVAPVAGATYRITFTSNGDMNPITGQGTVRAAQPGGFLASDLPADGFDITTVEGTPTVIEVDKLDVTKIVTLGGSFTLSFAGETTGPIPIPSSPNALRQDIEDSLNNLDAVGGVGGVVVTETAPGSNIFNITFTTVGNEPELIAVGTVPETQSLNLTPVLADPTAEFTLEFNGEATLPLSSISTAADIQTALNALGTVAAQGGVVVTNQAGAFKIDFNLANPNGNIPAVIVKSGGKASHEHQQLDLGSLAAYSSGFFELTFDGQKTGPLPVTATADEIAAALNNLPAINEVRADLSGLVAVTPIAGMPGKFDIEFNVFGDQDQITANGTVTTDRYPIQITQAHNGSQQPVIISEQVGGTLFLASASEFTKGNLTTKEVQRFDINSLTASPTGQFSIEFGASSTVPLSIGATITEVAAALNALETVRIAGGVTVSAAPNNGYDITFNNFGDRASANLLVNSHEVQSVDLGTLAGTSGGEFVLKFGTFSTAPLPATSTAQEVQTALNGLDSVKTAGGVTVTSSSAGRFAVVFNNLGNEPSLTGMGGGTAAHEIQNIVLGDLRNVSGGKFNLTYNGRTTDAISSSASAAEIQAALNSLDEIKATRSDNSGAVVVTESAPGAFTVAFNAFGDLSTLTGRSLVTADRILNSVEIKAGSSNIGVPVVETIKGAANIKEMQTVSLAGLTGLSNEFQLGFNRLDNGLITASTTGILPASASATDVQAALNGIASIAAAGGVTVASGPGNTFNITFNNPGDQPAISGVGGVHEQQNLLLGELGKFPTGLFRIVVNGEATQALKVGASAAEVDAALDALASIKVLRSNNAGSVNVTAATDVLTGYTIDFNDLGNQQPVTAIATVAVEPALDIRESISGSDFALPVIETTRGQTIAIPVAEVTPGNATGKEVQSIDVNNLVNSPSATFTLGFDGSNTTVLSRYAQASDIQTALNALTTLPGKVTVTAGASNTFLITFNDNGNQPAISALGGVSEVQHLDTSAAGLSGSGTFKVSFGGVDSAVIPADSTAQEVSDLLNGISSIAAAGGVSVSQSTSGFDVRFNSFGDQASFTGALNVFEQQLLDLHHLASVENGSIRLTFGANTTAPLSAASDSTQIQDALNALPSIQALGNGTGAVTVVDVSPGVFQINFDVAGNQALISGTKNSFGTTERLPGSATNDELDSALDSVSFMNVTTTPGSAPNVVIAKFSESADQPLINGTVYVHENQRVDVYSVGDYVLSYNGDTTTPFKPNATPFEIRNALNVLPSIMALGGVRDVVIGENSSFSFTFNGDNDPVTIKATQFLDPLVVTTNTEGTAAMREIQTVDFTNKSAFIPEKFSAASLVGAIKDFNEIDSSTFHYIEQNGQQGFNEGDLPIDGILMARFLDQSTINFIPEAKLTAEGFFDSNNRL